MGRLGKILEFIRAASFGVPMTDTKADIGGGNIVNAPHFGAPGDDAHPLPGDYAAFVSSGRAGGWFSVGYVDPKNTQAAQAGERRVYARNAGGDQVCEVWLKNDGTALIDNENGSYQIDPDGTQTMQNVNGYIKLLADGTVDINGFIIGTNGNGTTAKGVSLDDHTHAQGADSAGNTQVDTEIPTA